MPLETPIAAQKHNAETRDVTPATQADWAKLVLADKSLRIFCCERDGLQIEAWRAESRKSAGTQIFLDHSPPAGVFIYQRPRQTEVLK